MCLMFIISLLKKKHLNSYYIVVKASLDIL